MPTDPTLLTWIAARVALADAATAGPWWAHRLGKGQTAVTNGREWEGFDILRPFHWAEVDDPEEVARSNGEYVAAHDPDTMRAIYAVLDAAERRRHLADQLAADFLDDDEFASVTTAHRLLVEAEDAALAALERRIGARDDG